MKKCSNCESSDNEFPKRKASKDGFATECKVCKSARAKDDFKNNKSFRAKAKARAKKNEKLRKEKDPAYRNSLNVWKALKKSKRVPKWVKMADFKKVYHRCHKKGADVYSVDHIIPLFGELVCGLHVPKNLRVITKVANMKKGNRF